MVRDHDDHDVGGLGAFEGRVGGGGAGVGEEESLEGRGVDVVGYEGEVGAEELGRHAVAHGAEAGEEDGGVRVRCGGGHGLVERGYGG